MFQEVDPLLGPEMRSTGEVLGIASTTGEAFFKAQEATQSKLPTEGSVLISVNSKDKPEVVDLAKSFREGGFKIYATRGTNKLLNENGIPSELVKKRHEGRPNLQDLIVNGDVQMIINTPAGKESAYDDSYVRRSAIKAKIPYITTVAAGKAAAEGILYEQKHAAKRVESLQEWHSEIRDR